jgi:hypothetical protein
MVGAEPGLVISNPTRVTSDMMILYWATKKKIQNYSAAALLSGPIIKTAHDFFPFLRISFCAPTFRQALCWLL